MEGTELLGTNPDPKFLQAEVQQSPFGQKTALIKHYSQFTTGKPSGLPFAHGIAIGREIDSETSTVSFIRNNRNHYHRPAIVNEQMPEFIGLQFDI
ncbi:MAG: hypothetical protein V2J25_03985 [Desulfatiglans sp.]|nr:hypothetical protein [Desulfatiglans sp.]